MPSVKEFNETLGLASPKRSPFHYQIGGNHYSRLAIQPFQYSMANGLDPMQHTIIKYVTRFRDKGGRESLEKAIHTIQMLIEHEYGLDG
ncbi:DUF3310 domain-containing protein [Aquisediminimonas sediminicola]|uniref:DUF3310 domain-containing protein n=1 Tax=Alteraquisediminimonas sediminicola TaxID=2676787 RepID=UPI001C8E4C94|nr:DUF3310 domain-containing protein [Aquisediminimonas sediminicola]